MSMRRLLLFAWFAVLAAGQADFRQASWGMTRAQVLATEAKYLFDVEHDEENDIIVDFKTIEPVPMELYGRPASRRAFWESDLYQQESKAYLDQDRAAPSEILPSDRFVGLAVSLGQLKLYTQWAVARTKILHGLTGQDRHISHKIEYLSVELEGLEKEVRGSAQ
jgi:hypothetical protein